MKIKFKHQKLLIAQGEKRVGIYEACNGNIHLIDSPLIGHIMMDENLMLPQSWLTKCCHPACVPSTFPALGNNCWERGNWRTHWRKMVSFLGRGGRLLLYFLLSGFMAPATLSLQLLTLSGHDTDLSSFSCFCSVFLVYRSLYWQILIEGISAGQGLMCCLPRMCKTRRSALVALCPFGLQLLQCKHNQ